MSRVILTLYVLLLAPVGGTATAGSDPLNALTPYASVLDFTEGDGFGVSDDRREPVDAVVIVERVNFVGADERIVDALDHLGYRVHRVQALIGIHLAGAVAVTGYLPSRAIDRFQAGLYFLDGLVAGQRTESA